MEKLKGVAIAILLWASLIASSNAAHNSNYGFTPASQIITMDVVNEDGYGTSGTWLCESLRACYMRVLEAEWRGAHIYCRTITLKRGGIVVWSRDYSDPYWVARQNLAGKKI